MKALITGIEGFVGPYLDLCIRGQNIESFGTFFLPPSITGNLYPMDVTNLDQVSKIMNKIKPDLIFHLAGFSSVGKSHEQPELCKKINIEGTRNLLNSIISNKLNPKVLIVSSAEVYGKPQFVPITEKHPLSSLSPYAESRILQENVCQEMAEKHKISLIIARSFNHTGPGQTDTFVIPSFAKQIVANQKKGDFTIKVGNLEAIRDFSDVRDIVKAYFIVITKGKLGEIYNICSAKGYSIKVLLQKLIKLSGDQFKCIEDPARVRPSDIPVLIGSNEKFKKDTNWSPEIDIETTLSDILNYFRNKKE